MTILKLKKWSSSSSNLSNLSNNIFQIISNIFNKCDVLVISARTTSATATNSIILLFLSQFIIIIY
jgi:hypothetical protein